MGPGLAQVCYVMDNVLEQTVAWYANYVTLDT